MSAAAVQRNVARAFGLAFLLFVCSCVDQAALPPLPQVDASRFQKDVADAIGRASSEAKANPHDPERTLRLCMILHAHEQYKSAGECYKRAYRLDPKRFDTLYCWGHALAAEGAYAEAAGRLRQALAIRSDSLPAQLKLAEVVTDSGDASQSVALYRSILAGAPDEPRAHYGLGRALGGDAALAEFRKALEMFPRYGAAQFALATAYRRMADQAKAQDVLRNYERDKLLLPPLKDPEMASVRSLNVSAGALMQRAAEQVVEGRLEDAISLYRRAIAADPKLTRAYTDLISLYGRLHQDSKAEESYHQAIELDPSEADTYYNFAVFCFERGRRAEAKAGFEHAIRLRPRHAEALNNLAAVLEQEGKLDQAALYYRRATDVSSSYPLAHFHLGRIYANEKKYALAISEFERSLEPSSETTPVYLYALAATHARAGHRTLAVDLMRNARKQAESRGQAQVVASIDRDLAALEHSP